MRSSASCRITPSTGSNSSQVKRNTKVLDLLAAEGKIFAALSSLTHLFIILVYAFIKKRPYQVVRSPDLREFDREREKAVQRV